MGVYLNGTKPYTLYKVNIHGPHGPRTAIRFAMHTKCVRTHFGAVKLGFAVQNTSRDNGPVNSNH